MERWRDRFATASLGVWFLYYALVFGAAMFVLPGASFGSPGRSIRSGLFFGIVMTALLAMRRRRECSSTAALDIPGRRSIARALRTGDLPSDPSLDPALGALVPRRRRQLRFWVIVDLCLFGGAGVISVYSALQDSAWLIYVALDLGLVIAIWTSAVVARKRLNRLESGLRDRAHTRVTSPTRDGREGPGPEA